MRVPSLRQPLNLDTFALELEQCLPLLVDEQDQVNTTLAACGEVPYNCWAYELRLGDAIY